VYDRSVSYTGTQVYFPAGTNFAAVRDALATSFPSVTATPGQILVEVSDTKQIRVSHDTASHVPEEAKELAGRAESSIAAVLANATHRFEITPADPAADPDDVYNELLLVFETLRALPNAIGLDPFDGQLYLDAPTSSSPSPTAKAAAKRPTKAVAKRPTKAVKRPAKAAVKRPTKAATKRPTKATAKRPAKAASKRRAPKRSRS
jgi:hypothetical protein